MTDNKTAVFVPAVAVFLLSACVPVSNQNANQSVAQSPAAMEHKEAQPALRGIDFACRNGQKFIINFSKQGNTAQFLLSGDSSIHILKNLRLGSGVAYSDEKFVYEEHHGVAKLSHPVNSSTRVTTCHKTKYL